MGDTHDLCQIKVDETQNLTENSGRIEASQKPGHREDPYLREERLYKVYHEKHYDGIGPTDEESGLPFALRTSVDKPKHWYKNMFKAMHQAGRAGYVGDTGTEYDTDDTLTIDETNIHKSGKIRFNPGSISNFTPGPAYV